MKNKSIWSILIIFVLLAGIAFGLPTLKKTKIAWDPNTEPDLAGYKVYWSTSSGVYNDADSVSIIPTPPDTVPPTSVLFSDLFPITLPKGKHFFVATAFDTSGNESGFSNEVSYSFWFLNQPGNLRLE